MRWEALFADLEAQLEAADLAEFAGEVADRSRAEVAAQHLVDRLRPAVGTLLGLRLLGGAAVGGRLAAVGPDWMLLATPTGAETLVRAAAVLSLTGLPVLATESSAVGQVEARLGLAHALRCVARDRTAVVVGLVDGVTWAGTIDRVGADFVDLAEHLPDEPRRSAAVREVRTIPFDGLVLIRPA